jgi:hypothetical protein
MGNNNICATNCNHRTAATMYTVETLFCFRYITVNILQEGGKYSNNNNNNNNMHIKEVGEAKLA